MNILVVGSGKGSWAVRGCQLGEAIGARVVSELTPGDLAWAELVVLVKRAGPQCAPYITGGIPIVWDALDFWPQPLLNNLTATAAQALLETTLQAVKPTLTIGATIAQAQAANGVYLPHHSWSGLVPTPARETVKTVAYQGGEVFLGRWGQRIEHACKARGWRFVLNPESLSEADILVAFRDGTRDGWMCREWKSGVKCVNAIAAGRPLITQASAAVREIAPLGSVVDDATQLDDALDTWASYDAREAVVVDSLIRAPQYALPVVAAVYRRLLASVAVPCL